MIAVSDLNTLQFDEALCNGCAICVDVCPHAVYLIVERRARVVQGDACMECGACQLNCPTGAILVESGVGCAQAMINAALRGQEEAVCEC